MMPFLYFAIILLWKQSNLPFAFLAAMSHCWFIFSAWSTPDPISLTHAIILSIISDAISVPVIYFFLNKEFCIKLHYVIFNLLLQPLSHLQMNIVTVNFPFVSSFKSQYCKCSGSTPNHVTLQFNEDSLLRNPSVSFVSLLTWQVCYSVQSN